MAVRAGVLCALIVAVMALFLTLPERLSSCGPFFEQAVFTVSETLPLTAVAQGKWDVIQPSYRHASLIVAYRYLSGNPLTKTELAAIETGAQPSGVEETSASRVDAVQVWLEAKKRVPNAQNSPVGRYRQLPDYQEYPNCLDHAFLTAAHTLVERIERFGADSSAVAEWLNAQDTVFRNCSGRKAEIPPPVPEGLPPLIHADRAYQIAAAHFYAGNFDTAAAAFQHIARDDSSPWKTLAALLVARCRIRQAMLGNDRPAPDRLAEAEVQLQAILKAANLSSVHASAARLLNFAQIRLRAGEKLAELGRALLQTAEPSGLPQVLADYHYLFDKLLLLHRADTAARDDLTDWLLNFQSSGAGAVEPAFERWKATGALPWLVGAITRLPATDSRAAELIRSADRVKRESPAYASVAFHSIRLLAATGNEREARRRLDSLLADELPPFTASTRNLLKAQRMSLARTFPEFLQDAARDAPTSVIVGNELEVPPAAPTARYRALFDRDAAVVLNEKLPLRLLSQAAPAKVLPSPAKREVAVAAWVRAVALEDDAAARLLAAAAAGVAPDLKDPMAAYLEASSAEERRFIAATLILEHPGLRPWISTGFRRGTPVGKLDSLRDNWWCSFGAESGSTWNYYRTWVEPGGLVESPAFLTASERLEAEGEWRRLSALPAAPNLLADRVIAWAKRHPDDRRVPKSLHLAVRATRYGCTDENTTKFSREAFRLLHRRYPNSEWASRTKYWY